MSVYFWEGEMLLEGGKIAMHEDCCCDEPPYCQFPMLQLTVTFPITITGTITSMESESSHQSRIYVTYTLGGPFVIGNIICVRGIDDYPYNPLRVDAVGTDPVKGTYVVIPWVFVEDQTGTFENGLKFGHAPNHLWCNGQTQYICPPAVSGYPPAWECASGVTINGGNWCIARWVFLPGAAPAFDFISKYIKTIFKTIISPGFTWTTTFTQNFAVNRMAFDGNHGRLAGHQSGVIPNPPSYYVHNNLLIPIKSYVAHPHLQEGCPKNVYATGWVEYVDGIHAEWQPYKPVHWRPCPGAVPIPPP